MQDSQRGPIGSCAAGRGSEGGDAQLEDSGVVAYVAGDQYEPVGQTGRCDEQVEVIDELAALASSTPLLPKLPADGVIQTNDLDKVEELAKAPQVELHAV